MMILQKNKVRLANDCTYKNNPASSLGIHITAAKVEQCRIVADNRREKVDKKETAKKTAAQNFHLQQKMIWSFSEMPRLHEQCIDVSHWIIHVYQPC